MAQDGAIFVEGTTYLRMRESGNVFPIHEEQEKLVRKEQAEYVLYKDGKFSVVKQVESEEKRVISTPARKPPPVQKVASSAIDLTIPEQ